MEKDPNCVFCKIIAGEIPANKVFEDDDFVAILDIKPNNLGHTLLIPKNHHKNIFDLPDRLLEKLGKRIQMIAAGVLKGAEATGVNVGMNNGKTAGQQVLHAHIHLIPRFQGDGLIHWHQKDEISQEDFIRMAEQISASIQ